MSSKMPFTAVNRKFNVIPKVDFNSYTDALILSYNPIETLEGLPQLTNFSSFYFDNTKLKSYEYAISQPTLKNFYCRNTQLGKEKYNRLMALIVFGDQVKSVNGLCPTQELIKIAQMLREHTIDYLYKGWVIREINPLTLFDTKTLQQKVISVVNNKEEDTIDIYDDEFSNCFIDGDFLDPIYLRYRFNDLVHRLRPRKELSLVFENIHRPRRRISCSHKDTKKNGVPPVKKSTWRPTASPYHKNNNSYSTDNIRKRFEDSKKRYLSGKRVSNNRVNTSESIHAAV